MYEDTPDTIAQEIKKILYEMQSNNLYLDENNEYEFKTLRERGSFLHKNPTPTRTKLTVMCTSKKLN